MSLNSEKGFTISPLEGTLIVLDKILSREIKNNNKKGLIISKGKINELKMTFVEAQQNLKKLNDYFGIKGAMSFGICGTCSNFNNKSNSTKHFGTCSGKTVHEFDSCDKHSKKKGGFGV